MLTSGRERDDKGGHKTSNAKVRVLASDENFGELAPYREIPPKKFRSRNPKSQHYISSRGVAVKSLVQAEIVGRDSGCRGGILTTVRTICDWSRARGEGL